MMHEIRVIETPREEGVSLKEVRAAIATKFPKFKIAGLIEDAAEDVWRAKLVKKAEFPLKNMGPKDDEAMPGSEGEDDEEKPKKPKLEDAEEEKLKDEDVGDDVPDDDTDDESGGEEGNPKDKAEHLIKMLEDLLPQLQHLLGGGGGPPLPDDGGMPPAGPGADIGPHMAPDGAPPDGAPVGGPAGPPPPLPPAGPPHRPGIPGGRPRPGGRPMPGQVPAFAKRRTQLLERDADVDEKTARDELLVEFPDYTVEDLKRIGSRYVVKLAIRQ